jgi:hypothetical protein
MATKNGRNGFSPRPSGSGTADNTRDARDDARIIELLTTINESLLESL